MSKSTAKGVMFKSYFVLIVMVLICFLVVKWSWGQYQTRVRADTMHTDAFLKQDKAQDRFDSLESRNSQLETKEGRDDILIDRFAVKRPGERVLILIEEDTIDAKKVEEKEPTVWERMKNWW